MYVSCQLALQKVLLNSSKQGLSYSDPLVGPTVTLGCGYPTQPGLFYQQYVDSDSIQSKTQPD